MYAIRSYYVFDVSHMGVYDVRGADAASFLDSVCGNDCGGLNPGESLYTHFLTPDADVIDDTLVYRRGWDDYLVVVNASNDDKDRTWLESVRDGKVRIDNARPFARTYGYNAVITSYSIHYTKLYEVTGIVVARCWHRI